MTFISFPSIVNFYTLRRTVKKHKIITKPIEYKCKIKLHGTNCGIIILPTGQVMAQSRTQIIGTGNDNVGFSKWVDTNSSHWSKLASGEQITVFGEWCGPNVQKGTAANKVGKYFFAVFAIQIGDKTVDNLTSLIVEPTTIEQYIAGIPDVYTLDWYTPGDITIDFLNMASSTSVVSHINNLVSLIEPCDPWVEKTFGVRGICEGLVYYPQVFAPTRWDFTNLAFKAKGEQHKVVNTQPACVDVPIISTPTEFAKLTCTLSRLEQAFIQGCLGKKEKNQIGNFIAWLINDIKKETQLELKTNNISWNSAKEDIKNIGRKWFMEKIGS